MDKEPSHFLYHVACEACGSSDANSLYSDGHQHCFACEAYVPGDGSEAPAAVARKTAGLIHGEYRDLITRGIREETCRG